MSLSDKDKVGKNVNKFFYNIDRLTRITSSLQLTIITRYLQLTQTLSNVNKIITLGNKCLWMPSLFKCSQDLIRQLFIADKNFQQIIPGTAPAWY